MVLQPRGDVTGRVGERVSGKGGWGGVGPVFEGPMASSAGQLLWGPGPLPGLDAGLNSPRSARAAQHYARSSGRVALNEQASLMLRMTAGRAGPLAERDGPPTGGFPGWTTSPRLLGKHATIRPLDQRPATSQARMQTAWQAPGEGAPAEERLGEAAFGVAWRLLRGVERRTRKALAPNGALLATAEDFRAELERVTGTRLTSEDVEHVVRAQQHSGSRGKYTTVVDVSSFVEEVMGVPLGRSGRGETGRESPAHHRQQTPRGRGGGGARVLAGLPQGSALATAVEKMTEGVRELDLALVGAHVDADGSLDPRELASVSALLCRRGASNKRLGPISESDVRAMFRRFSLERDNGTVDFRQFLAKLAEVDPFAERRRKGGEAEGPANGMPQHRRNLDGRAVERELTRKLEQRAVLQGPGKFGTSKKLFAAGILLARDRAAAGKEAPSFTEFQSKLAEHGIAAAPQTARVFYRDAQRPSPSHKKLYLVVHGTAPRTWAPQRGRPLVSPASPAFNARVRFFSDHGATLRLPVRHRSAQVY